MGIEERVDCLEAALLLFLVLATDEPTGSSGRGKEEAKAELVRLLEEMRERVVAPGSS